MESIWLPFALTVISAVVAIVVYAWQKNLDRREKIRERHFETYIDIVDAISAMANSINTGGIDKEDVLSNYASAKMRFSLIASDKVLASLFNYDLKITSSEKNKPEELDKLLGIFLQAARQENLGKTCISAEQLILLSPFGSSVRK